jgi:hypothetical protein
MCGCCYVPKQLQNINNRCHHLARNLNDAYEKQGSVCSNLMAMFYATFPADHGRQNRHFKLWLFVGQRVMLRIATVPPYADLTGLVLFFGTNVLTMGQTWGKETGDSLQHGCEVARNLGLARLEKEK